MGILDALNIWLVELCSAGILPGEWLCNIVATINSACVLLGFGPQAWG